MRRILLAIALLGLASAPALRTAPATAQTAAGIVAAVERLAPSVVGLVVAYDAGGSDVVSGTAVAYRSDGFLITDAELLRGATAVQAVLPDGPRVWVDIQRNVYWDPFSRLAVIYLPGRTLTPASLADSSRLQTGEVVVTLSHPLGVQYSPAASAGVISGVDRRVGTGLALIQVDAPLIPGSGGTPIANQVGELAGMVTGKEVDIGVESIAYGIPSNTVRALADRLTSEGTLRRPRFGFSIQDAADVAFGWPGAAGVEIGWVDPGGPAGKAGVTSDSTLKAVNGTPVGSIDEFFAILEPVRAGDTVQLTVKPENLPERTIAVVTGSYPGLFESEVSSDGVATAGAAPGIWVNLAEDQLAEAEDYAWAHMDQSFEQFANVYLAEAPNGRALLETEFMRMAYAHYRPVRMAGAEEEDVSRVALRARGKLQVRLIIGLPAGSPDAAPQVTLKQGTQVVASESLPPTGEPSRAGIPLPAAMDPQYRWVGAVWVVPSTGLKPAEPLTLLIGPPSAPVATFTWELEYIR